jgi:hypothetical protein
MLALIIVYATILGALNLLRHSIMWRALINAAVFGFLSWWYFYLSQMWRSIFGNWKIDMNCRASGSLARDHMLLGPATGAVALQPRVLCKERVDNLR